MLAEISNWWKRKKNFEAQVKKFDKKLLKSVKRAKKVHVGWKLVTGENERKLRSAGKKFDQKLLKSVKRKRR